MEDVFLEKLSIKQYVSSIQNQKLPEFLLRVYSIVEKFGHQHFLKKEMGNMLTRYMDVVLLENTDVSINSIFDIDGAKNIKKLCLEYKNEETKIKNSDNSLNNMSSTTLLFILSFLDIRSLINLGNCNVTLLKISRNKNGVKSITDSDIILVHKYYSHLIKSLPYYIHSKVFRFEKIERIFILKNLYDINPSCYNFVKFLKHLVGIKLDWYPEDLLQYQGNLKYICISNISVSMILKNCNMYNIEHLVLDNLYLDNPENNIFQLINLTKLEANSILWDTNREITSMMYKSYLDNLKNLNTFIVKSRFFRIKNNNHVVQFNSENFLDALLHHIQPIYNDFLLFLPSRPFHLLQINTLYNIGSLRITSYNLQQNADIEKFISLLNVFKLINLLEIHIQILPPQIWQSLLKFIFRKEINSLRIIHEEKPCNRKHFISMVEIFHHYVVSYNYIKKAELMLDIKSKKEEEKLYTYIKNMKQCPISFSLEMKLDKFQILYN